MLRASRSPNLFINTYGPRPVSCPTLHETGRGLWLFTLNGFFIGNEISHKFQHARCVVVENVKYSVHFVVPKVALLFINCSLGGKYLIIARGCFGAIVLNWSMQKMVSTLYKYTK